MKREAVEMCAHCMSENTYPDKDVDIEGYVEHCKECGAEIFLCDECTQYQIMEYENDPKGREYFSSFCDWRKENGVGKCWRVQR